MKEILFLVCLMIFFSNEANAQVGIGTTNPDNSTVLDVQSNNKGVVFPRMLKADRLSISSPTTGLLVFQTDDNKGYYYFTGTEWKLINHQPETIAFEAYNTTNGTTISNGNTLNYFGEVYDTNNAWNGNTFTIPETGFYCFHISQYFTPTALGTNTTGLRFIVNNVILKTNRSIYYPTNINHYKTFDFTFYRFLNVNDVVRFVHEGSSQRLYNVSNFKSTITGYKIN